jgi:hypothetical protein
LNPFSFFIILNIIFLYYIFAIEYILLFRECQLLEAERAREAAARASEAA